MYAFSGKIYAKFYVVAAKLGLFLRFKKNQANCDFFCDFLL